MKRSQRNHVVPLVVTLVLPVRLAALACEVRSAQRTAHSAQRIAPKPSVRAVRCALCAVRLERVAVIPFVISPEPLDGAPTRADEEALLRRLAEEATARAERSLLRQQIADAVERMPGQADAAVPEGDGGTEATGRRGDGETGRQGDRGDGATEATGGPRRRGDGETGRQGDRGDGATEATGGRGDGGDGGTEATGGRGEGSSVPGRPVSPSPRSPRRLRLPVASVPPSPSGSPPVSVTGTVRLPVSLPPRLRGVSGWFRHGRFATVRLQALGAGGTVLAQEEVTLDWSDIRWFTGAGRLRRSRPLDDVLVDFVRKATDWAVKRLKGDEQALLSASKAPE